MDEEFNKLSDWELDALIYSHVRVLSGEEEDGVSLNSLPDIPAYQRFFFRLVRERCYRLWCPVAKLH